MTHRAPGRPPRPRTTPRAPLHDALPSYQSTQPREHARRLLRLFVATGCYVAGLCLVIALVGLVAAIRAHEHSSGPAADTRYQHSDQAGRPLLTTVLTGRAGDSKDFWTRESGPWRLRWSYNCGPDTTGYLMVSQTGRRPVARTRLRRHGRVGHGVTRWYPATGAQHFEVSSDCTWRIRVQGLR
jgi:hypothetical protein